MDGAPGELTLASHRVAVEFAAIEREGKSFTRVTADVFDANGLRLELKGDELTWDIDDPRGCAKTCMKCPGSSGHSVCAEFEPFKPDGNQDRAQRMLSRWHLPSSNTCRPSRARGHSSRSASDTTPAHSNSMAARIAGDWARMASSVSRCAKDCPDWSGTNPPQCLGDAAGIPVAVVCPNGPCQFTDISAGNSHTCAVDTSGDAWCWGSNNYGELGIGLPSRPPEEAPLHCASRRRKNSNRFAPVHTKTCGLTTMGKVYCWGINDLAIVPANSDPSRIVVVPELVDMPTRAAVTAIDLSAHHACALTASGSLFCWGTNSDLGHSGYGQFTAAPRCNSCPATPQLMQGAGITDLVMQRVSLVSTGVHGSCAHLTNEQTVCWGRPLPAFRHSRADRAVVARRNALLRDRRRRRCAARARALSGTACANDAWRTWARGDGG